jgi:hypothetical protein
MTSLLLYFLFVFGLAYVIGHARVSLPIREYLSPTPDVAPPLGGFGTWLVRLVECPACLSWHLGLWFGFFGWPLHATTGGRVGDALVLAFGSCGVSFILGRFTRLI